MTRITRILTLSFCLLNGRERIAAQTADDSLAGIWMARLILRPTSAGDLVLQRSTAGWRATLSGLEGHVDSFGDSVHVTFASGRFRGALGDGGRNVSGFWLQPAGTSPQRPNAVGARQPFATPLVLPAAGRGSWSGRVRQLEERFTLYLKIYRNPEGQLVAAFRNHDFNSLGGASVFRVSRHGDSVHFTARFENEPEIRHSAVIQGAPRRLRLFWRDVGMVLALEPRAPQEASGFFPRPPAQPRYTYRPPTATHDGWTTARAATVGIDERALERMIQSIIDTNPAVRGAPLIHSILVARRGKLVLEEYFFGYERDRPHDTRSAGKTFSSVMLGASMREVGRARIAPETKLYELVRDMGPFANPDPRKSEITLAHLMTHTAGFACDDYNDASPGNEATLERQPGSWWKYTLDLPMAHAPGSRYAYCSANMNLMGAALTTATKTWLPALFDRTVARPLQFGVYHWNLSPTDDGYLGGGSWLRPRDLLKIGQAYLAGGVWNGRRIVDSAWVVESTLPRIHISPATTGLSQEEFENGYSESDDGYAWHLGGGQYSASGNGGQLLIVAPKHDLVVVFTGANYGQGWIWGRWGPAFVGKGIIAAITR